MGCLSRATCTVDLISDPDKPGKKKMYSSPSLTVTLPPVKLFSQQRYSELGPKKLELSYFSPSYAIFSPQLCYFLLFSPSYTILPPPVMLFFSFPPSYSIFQLIWGKRKKQHNWGQQNNVYGGKNFKIAQDIYYITLTPSYAILKQPRTFTTKNQTPT